MSRKLEAPLAVLIQSTSAAGKSALMDAVLGLMPPEERIRYSAMTGQSLYYLGANNLQHKILAIAEDEGVRQASFATLGGIKIGAAVGAWGGAFAPITIPLGAAVGGFAGHYGWDSLAKPFYREAWTGVPELK